MRNDFLDKCVPIYEPRTKETRGVYGGVWYVEAHAYLINYSRRSSASTSVFWACLVVTVTVSDWLDGFGRHLGLLAVSTSGGDSRI